MHTIPVVSRKNNHQIGELKITDIAYKEMSDIIENPGQYYLGRIFSSREDGSLFLLEVTIDRKKTPDEPLSELQEATLEWKRQMFCDPPQHWKLEHFKAAERLLSCGYFTYSKPMMEIQPLSGTPWHRISRHLDDMKTLEII